MKKCPFCAELIQTDATKCRYCNEWLDKSNKNPFLDFISRTKNSILDEVNNKNKNVDHLFIPEGNKPLQIRRIYFYPDRFTADEYVRYFDKIVSMYYKPKVETRNFSTSYALDFKIGYQMDNPDGKEPHLEVYPMALNNGDSFIGNRLNKKEFEQVSLIHNLISTVTFENRIRFFLDELKQKGFFTYDDYEFKVNGEIVKKGKVIANLFEAIENKTIYFGQEWEGFKWTENNPFEFFITSGSSVRVKFLGMESGLKLKINTYANHDVFKSLIEYFVLNEKFPVD